MDLLNFNQTGKNRARRARTNFNNDALSYLEDIFKMNQYPDITERENLAKIIFTTEARIQVWFQNKRSRSRKFAKMNGNGSDDRRKNETKIESFSSNDSYNSNDSGTFESSSIELKMQKADSHLLDKSNFVTYSNNRFNNSYYC